MKKLETTIEPMFWPKREAAMRFNKLFAEMLRLLRHDIGDVKAKFSYKGILRSGATVKVSIERAETRLEECIDECLQYVLAKTESDGWKRRKMLLLLRELLTAHKKSVWDMLDQQVVQLIGAGHDSASVAEQSFRRVFDRTHDRIDKFSEGIGRPKAENWVNRHPILANGVSGTIGAGIGYLFGLIGG